MRSEDQRIARRVMELIDPTFDHKISSRCWSRTVENISYVTQTNLGNFLWKVSPHITTINTPLIATSINKFANNEFKYITWVELLWRNNH